MESELTTFEHEPRDCFSTENLFAAIDGQVYDSNSDFEQDVIDIFNEYLYDFPPHYTYRDSISWADRQGWLHVEGVRLTVTMPTD